MCFLRLSPENPKIKKNENFECTHQILDGSSTPKSKNHSYMQIITPFAVFAYN